MLASPLSTTVRFVCLLVHAPSSNDWHAHRVIRDLSTGKMVGIDDMRCHYVRIDGYPYVFLLP